VRSRKKGKPEEPVNRITNPKMFGKKERKKRFARKMKLYKTKAILSNAINREVYQLVSRKFEKIDSKPCIVGSKVFIQQRRKNNRGRENDPKEKQGVELVAKMRV